jgi:hypothetical protein
MTTSDAYGIGWDDGYAGMPEKPPDHIVEEGTEVEDAWYDGWEDGDAQAAQDEYEAVYG